MQRAVWSTCRTVRGAAVILMVSLCIGVIQSPAVAREGSWEPATLDDGIAAYRDGDPLRALATFSRLAQVRPQSSVVAIWAGVAAMGAGRTEEADAYFREALRRPHWPRQERVIRGWLARLSFLREQEEAERPTPIPHPDANSIAALARAANPALTSEQAIWMGDHVVAAAVHAGLDPFFLAAVVYIESGFHPTVRSRAGAIGLGQLRPQTARSAGVDPHDPWGNLLGAAMTLKVYYVRFRDLSLALAAYNAGEGAVHRYRGIPPYAETRWYIAAVWAVYHRIHPAG